MDFRQEKCEQNGTNNGKGKSLLPETVEDMSKQIDNTNNGGAKKNLNNNSREANIKTVSSIACPCDKFLIKIIDDGVVEHFKETIQLYCQEVKKLLEVIEEYNVVQNGIIEMDDNVLYSSVLNAVIPTELTTDIKMQASCGRKNKRKRLSVSEFLPFGKNNRFKGVLPSLTECKKLLEVPGTPLDTLSGDYVLCTECTSNDDILAEHFQNKLPSLPIELNKVLRQVYGDKNIHQISNIHSDDSIIRNLVQVIKKLTNLLNEDDKQIIARLKSSNTDKIISRELKLLENKGVDQESIRRLLDLDEFNYAIVNAIGKDTIITNFSSGYSGSCYYLADFSFKHYRDECQTDTFHQFPIYRFQNGRLEKPLSNGYEMFIVWSLFDLTPKYLYDRQQHIAMSGKIDKTSAQKWLDEFNRIRKWFIKTPELFDVKCDTFLNPEICLEKFLAGEEVLGMKRSDMNEAVFNGRSTICNNAIGEYTIEKLLECDLIRSDIRPAYEKPCLTDQARGHWDLWEENAENGYEQNIIVPAYVMARNPMLDIKWDGVIGIDFGTKSTTVVCMTDREKPYLLPIGNRDLLKISNSGSDFYENPTIMQFRDYNAFMQDYARKQGRPPTVWNDLTVSHESERTLSSCENGPLFASFLNELKQWAGGKQTHRVKDLKGQAFDLLPYLQLSKGDIDPIELYAYEIGLQINNMKNGIYMRYELSYPVKYDLAIREHICKSFERGLKKSLPSSIINNDKLMAKFKVRMRISEPAAYALCALQELELVPKEGQEETFYSVFDFGGGTTDFDYGICREGNDDEQDAGYYIVIEHFEPQGDKYLGGENLLQLMAYEVFKQNRELLANGGGTARSGSEEKGALDKKIGKKAPITFSKPFEDFDTYFTGSEILVDNSSEARLNMRTVMNALRPLWEESNNKGNAMKIGNKLSVTLFNRDARAITNIELEIDPSRLKDLMKERISKGVSQFFVQLKQALRRYGSSSLKKIHILLAGNSSKSPLVTQAFNEQIDALKKDFKSKNKSETSFEFILHQPLGFSNSHQKGDKVEAETSNVNTQQAAEAEDVSSNLSSDSLEAQSPTGKTGVAFGLVYSRDGGNVKIVDKNLDETGEISFRFFVGKPNRHQQFEPLLMRDTEQNKWIKVLNVADRSTAELKYTEEPAAATGLLPVIKTHTIPISVSQPSEKDFKLFVRIASATSIDYVLSKDETSIDLDKIVTITLD